MPEIPDPVLIGQASPGVANTAAVALATTAEVAEGQHVILAWTLGGEREPTDVSDDSGLGISWEVVPDATAKGELASAAWIIGYCENGLPEGTTITVTSAPAQNAARSLSAYVTELAPRRPVDQAASFTHAAQEAWDTGETDATTVAVELIMVLVTEGAVSSTTSTVSTPGYTELLDFKSGGRCAAVYFKQVSATGKQRAQGTFSTSDGAVAGVIATFSATSIPRGPGPTGLPDLLPESTGTVKTKAAGETLEAAINALKPNEELLVPDPVFPEVAYAAPLITVEGAAGETITVRGVDGEPIPIVGRCKLDGAAYLRIVDFEIDAFTSANVGAFTRGSCHDVEWLNCVVHDAQSEGFTATLEGGVPTRIHWVNCLAYNNGRREEVTKNLDHGFYVSGHELLVLNCISHHNAARGIQFHPEATDSIIAHFTAVFNGRGGIQISGDEEDEHNSHNCRVVNSISAFNEYGIRTFWATEEGGIAGTSNYAWRNLTHENSKADYLVTAPGSLFVEEKVFGDPLLDGEEYRPAEGSPALEAADSEWSPAFDFTGAPRPSRPALGALELVVVPPVQGTGTLGVEARHQWNGGLTMGDLTVSPRIKLERIGGLQALPDPEDNRNSAMGRRGEISRASFRRGKTLVYEGRVEAQTLADLRQMMSALASEFDDLDEGRMLIAPHPDYPAGFSRFYLARALTFEPGDEELDPFARRQFQQPFAIGLRMSDARFYDTQQVIESTGEIAATDGLTLPFTPPVTFPETGAGAGTAVVTNDGNAATDPVIDIYGPVTNPILSNLTQGQALAFTDLVLDSATFLRIDFATRQVLLQGTSDYRSKIDWSASDWWDPGAVGLQPGENLIQLRGAGIADPAKAQITFNPAYVS